MLCLRVHRTINGTIGGRERSLEKLPEIAEMIKDVLCENFTVPVRYGLTTLWTVNFHRLLDWICIYHGDPLQNVYESISRKV